MTSTHPQTNKPVAAEFALVLPVALSQTGRDENDLQRLLLLLRTYDRFWIEKTSRLLIVCPPGDMSAVSDGVRSCNLPNIEVVDEFDVCPEFAEDPESFNSWPKLNKGWIRQQLLKLAIAEHLPESHYLTLDSDVLFVQETLVGDLFDDAGRAMLNVQKRSFYERTYTAEFAAKTETVMRDRYRRSAELMGFRRSPFNSDHWYGETPVTMNKSGVCGLIETIDRRSNLGWRRELLVNRTWTEYSLYFQHLERVGEMEQHYAFGDADTVLRLSDSLWLDTECYLDRRDLESWNLARAFSPKPSGMAVCVQSYLGYEVDRVATLVGPFLD